MMNHNQSIQILMKEVAALRLENQVLQKQISDTSGHQATSNLPKAPERLDHSDSLFRLLVESLPFSILIVDKDGIITKANSRIMTDFGYQPEELINQPVEILLPHSLRLFDYKIVLKEPSSCHMLYKMRPNLSIKQLLSRVKKNQLMF